MTYFSRATYTSGGAEFNIVGNWLNQDNIVVTVNGVTMVNGVDYTINTTTNKFTLTTPVASGVEVTVERTTPLEDDELEVTFTDGSFLDANSLNRASLQNCYQNQELRDDFAVISGAVSSLETTVNAFDARITSLEAQIGTGGSLVPISRGGTNATTASDARDNLGLGSMAVQASSNVSITGGAASGLSLSSLSSPLEIASGGTSASTKTAAFDALSPLTTKGDLVVFDGTNNKRLAVGTNNYVLTADSSATNGFAWKAVTAATAMWAHTSLNSSLGVTTGTTTVVVNDVEDSDTDNIYSTSTGRYTPSASGKYIATFTTRIESMAADSLVDLAIRKNGTAVRTMTMNTNSGINGATISDIISCNGSTDYIDFTVIHSAGSTKYLSAGGYTVHAVGRIGA